MPRLTRLVDLTTISSEELQRISDEIIELKLIATDSAKKGGEVAVDR